MPSETILRPLRLLVAVLVAVLGVGCAGSTGSLPPLPEWEPVPEPSPDRVESMLVLVGDPGESIYGRAPVLSEAAREVEVWSARLARDSAVSVVFLGDIVYPEGLRPPWRPQYARDSLYVRAQIDVVDGPAALAHNTPAYFVAGNHDWGEARGLDGVHRLRNLEAFLDRSRDRWDVAVELLPPAGDPGPAVLDIGRHLRLILLDTAWWLLANTPELKLGLIQGIELAMANAGDREVLLAAHHPWQTAGPHGGTVDLWQAFGVRWLLYKTGSLPQDINSRPMKDLREYLEQVFSRVGPPLAFIGGHDHSLQVIEGQNPLDPRWSIVSGTGAKVSDVGHVPGMRFRAAKAGYMTLYTLHDGSSILHVRGAPEGWVECPNEHYSDPAACMAAAPAAFETLFSIRLTRD